MEQEEPLELQELQEAVVVTAVRELQVQIVVIMDLLEQQVYALLIQEMAEVEAEVEVAAKKPEQEEPAVMEVV